MKRRQFLESFAASALAIGTRPLLASPVLSPRSFSLAQAANSPDQPSGKGDAAPEFFYRPMGAWAADFIPYYKDGRYHLFFLLDWRDKEGHGEGTPWYQVSTTDFVHFEEHGEMLPRGTKDDQDLFVFTGSVTYGEGSYHIFYTGHNPHLRAQGKPEQGVMHAVSKDLLKWQKVPEDTFYAPGDHFEAHDWRDPFVFWNKKAGEYWMLLAARLKSGPSRRRGCTALCASKDLKKWEVRKPFWTPGLYFTHECPDLFRMGDWWYLVFSEFSDLVRTRYRMSRSIGGPWLTPKDDYFDGRAFYAAKTASDGQRRFIFGWDPTRAEKKDYYRWDWGGNLVVHELFQESDGTLSVKVPATVDAAWKKPLESPFSSHLGEVKVGDNQIEIAAPGSFGCAAAGIMPDRCKIETQIQFEPGIHGCGVLMRTSDDLESSYYLRLEPQNGRLVFDSWPRGSGPEHPITSTDGGYMAGLDRWIKLDHSTPIDVKVFVDGTIAVAYVVGKISLCMRMYDLRKGRWGFFVNQGSAKFQNVRVTEL
jgi:beta-fructofuranosidase